MNRRVKGALTSLVTALAVMGLVSGCQLADEIDTETVPETEQETQTETEVLTEAESESESELQTDVVYESEDDTIRIILPDSTWKVTQDNDDMLVFTSGDAAMITVVHADDEESMKNISVMRSRDELVESLTGQYPEEDAFEILSYDEKSSSTVNSYEYVVKYTYPTSMWTYSVTYGILAADDDAAYVVSGTVTDDDKTLLDEVETSVESFSVLDSKSVFSVLPGTVKNNEGETEDESEELASLTEYEEPVTLYAADDVNVRKQPSTEADVVGNIAKGEAVSVTAETTNWFRVSISGTTGYVNKAFLVYSSQLEDATDESDETSQDGLNGESYTLYATSDVNLRSSPSTDGSISGGLSAGSAVTVVGETGDWYIVSVNGTTSYVSKDYFSSSQPETSQTSDSYSYDNYSQDYSGYDYTDSGTYDYSYYDNSSYDNYDYSGDVYSSSTGMISGTVTGVSGSTVAVEGSNGDTYYIDYSGADSLQVGSWVNATVDYAEETASGGLYASSVY